MKLLILMVFPFLVGCASIHTGARIDELTMRIAVLRDDFVQVNKRQDRAMKIEVGERSSKDHEHELEFAEFRKFRRSHGEYWRGGKRIK